MPTKKQAYDWEAIEREYRAGQLSVREIAQQYGCSHTAIQKKAKAGGWSRDLASRVRKEVAKKLVADSTVASGNATTGDEDQIVEAAATRGAEVIRIHRRDIRALSELVAKLRNEVETGTKLYLSTYRGEIIQKTVSLSAAEKAAAVANLAAAEHKLVALERQAFNLNDSGLEDPDAPQAILIRVKNGEGG